MSEAGSPPAGGRRTGHSPTLETVARAAGVSRATVSRVINDSPRVSPEVRASVEAAIGQLGYVPNRAARSLVTRRSDSVALVIPEPGDRIFADPYFAAVVRAIGRELSAVDKQLILLLQEPAGVAGTHPDGDGAGTDAEGREAAAARRRAAMFERYVAGGHVDGVLVVSVHGEDPLPSRLARLGTPTVLGGRYEPLPAGITSVDIDNLGAARAAVSRLAGYGARRIATVTGPADMNAARDRLAGYREALAAAGLGPVDGTAALIADGAFTEAGGHAAMRALLAREPGIDALFAASNLMALGALRALREAGRRVPEDVAVIGFDDAGFAGRTDPPLTTVRQPMAEVAREMTRLLLAKIDGRPTPDRVVLPAELVLRASG